MKKFAWMITKHDLVFSQLTTRIRILPVKLMPEYQFEAKQFSLSLKSGQLCSPVASAQVCHRLPDDNTNSNRSPNAH